MKKQKTETASINLAGNVQRFRELCQESSVSHGLLLLARLCLSCCLPPFLPLVVSGDFATFHQPAAQNFLDVLSQRSHCAVTAAMGTLPAEGQEHTVPSVQPVSSTVMKVQLRGLNPNRVPSDVCTRRSELSVVGGTFPFSGGTPYLHHHGAQSGG